MLLWLFILFLLNFTVASFKFKVLLLFNCGDFLLALLSLKADFWVSSKIKRSVTQLHKFILVHFLQYLLFLMLLLPCQLSPDLGLWTCIVPVIVPVAAMLRAAEPGFIHNLAKCTQLLDLLNICDSFYAEWLFKNIRCVDLPLEKFLASHISFFKIWLIFTHFEFVILFIC